MLRYNSADPVDTRRRRDKPRNRPPTRGKQTTHKTRPGDTKIEGAELVPQDSMARMNIGDLCQCGRMGRFSHVKHADMVMMVMYILGCWESTGKVRFQSFFESMDDVFPLMISALVGHTLAAKAQPVSDANQWTPKVPINRMIHTAKRKNVMSILQNGFDPHYGNRSVHFSTLDPLNSTAIEGRTRDDPWADVEVHTSIGKWVEYYIKLPGDDKPLVNISRHGVMEVDGIAPPPTHNALTKLFTLYHVYHTTLTKKFTTAAKGDDT